MNENDIKTAVMGALWTFEKTGYTNEELACEVVKLLDIDGSSPKSDASSHVPGLWMCPTCNFRLQKRIIGKNTVSDDPRIHISPCPNDGAVMEPVTWEEYSKGVELFAEQKTKELRDFAATVSGIALQEWTWNLPIMQQSVLLAAVRGPDGLPKYGAVKNLCRWFRRCILLSALDRQVLDDPCSDNGGSFTGPSLSMFSHSLDKWEVGMDSIVDQYLKELDAIPHHFQLHFMPAAEIVGYKHPEERIRVWWTRLYCRLVRDMHLHPELADELDDRLGDSRSGWLKHADPATIA